MRSRGRTRIFVALVLPVAVAAGAAGYFALSHVPDFYAEAVRRTPAANREASRTMQRKMSALAGDTLRPGEWRAVFTDEQINAFLAVDLPTRYRDLLPPEVHEPRVAIAADGVSIGWRYDGRFGETIYSLRLVPYIVRPNVVAVRLVNIRAGALPVPLGEVLDELSRTAAEVGLRLQWQQADGDPVAVVELPPAEDESEQRLSIESIKLRPGAMALAGRTLRVPPTAPRAAVILRGVRVADQSATNEKSQR